MAKISPARVLHFDTEFTSLGDPWPVHLISVGLCDDAGLSLFYAESSDFDPSLCSDFTRSQVLPLLERGGKTLDYPQLCSGFFSAISKIGVPCALAADSEWDWLWAQMMARGEIEARGKLFLDDPSTLPLWPSNLSPRFARLAFEALPGADKSASWTASRHWFSDKFPHHALSDAVGNALAARAAIEVNSVRDASRPADLAATFSLPSSVWDWNVPSPRVIHGVFHA